MVKIVYDEYMDAFLIMGDDGDLLKGYHGEPMVFESAYLAYVAVLAAGLTLSEQEPPIRHNIGETPGEQGVDGEDATEGLLAPSETKPIMHGPRRGTTGVIGLPGDKGEPGIGPVRDPYKNDPVIDSREVTE